ncbi:MAG: DUF1844 domain-containing protein [Candidatus Methylacidiphilales bacterium]
MSDPTSSNDSRAMAQRFVQFVMIQAQNVLYVLGRIPGPDGRAPRPNLEAGKMLIDQLDMIKEKTKGNLIPQEEKILKETLAELQIAFVEASGGTPVGMMPDRSPMMDLPEFDDSDAHDPVLSEPPAQSGGAQAPAPTSPAPDPADPEKKKYFKSYG